MNKAIIIITTDDRKSDRFIKCTNEKQYQQEWEDGWCFDKTQKYALRKNSSPIVYFDEIAKVVKAINETDRCLIIWVNQYLFFQKMNVLIREVNYVYNELIKIKFDVKVAGHNIPKVNYSFKPYSYSLEQTKELRFQKIITKNNSREPILNASADFDDIEEVFFHQLEVQKKKLINLWLPLAIDMQGLKDDNKQHLKDYFEAIKKDVKEYVNDEFVKSWEEIKNFFTGEVKHLISNDLPSKIVKSLKEEKTIAEDFYNTYVKNSESNNFLPNWLQEVVRVLDEKIKQN